MHLFRRPTFLAALALASSALILGAAGADTPATAPVAASTAPAFRRDWKSFPAIVQLQNQQNDIYAIGDLHGDYEKAVKLLAGAHLIAGIPSEPKKVEWAAGKSILVCTGDMIDKWTQSVEVLQLMRALQSSAAQAGGQVIITLGNHEAEFLAAKGDNKKAAEFQKELLAQSINPADLAAGRDADGLGAWLRNRPIAAKINGWFFCHAGNTFGMSVAEIETAVETGVDKDGFGTFILAQPNSILQAPMGGVPWWLQADAAAIALPSAPLKDSAVPAGALRLHKYAAALGCEHLVVGHHPSKISFGGGIERAAGQPFAYDGVLFLIDMGMSHGAQDGRGIVLKIHPGARETAIAIDDTGKETSLWTER